jgi:parallel beta-helix repeat protein
MFKSKPSKPVLYEFVFRVQMTLKGLFSAAFRRNPLLRASYVVAHRRISLLAVIAVLALTIWLPLHSTGVASAATPTLNFQARLESNTGAIAPDGDYNVEFNLYQGGTSAGGGTLKWTETYKEDGGPDNRVRVSNGYLTVNLGSLTSFPGTINWDDDLFLGMNIGGTTTGTPSWDGEMSPYLKLTSVPYAFQAQSAQQLQAIQGSNTGTLLFDNLTANRKYILPDTGLATTASPGTICVFNGAVSNCPAATGSAYYIHNDTALQTSANFNIQGADNGTDGTVVGVLRGAAGGQTVDLLQLQGSAGGVLAAFTASGDLQVANSIDTRTATTLSVGTANATAISIGQSGVTATIEGALTVEEASTFNGNVTLAAGKTLTVTGDTTANRPVSPAEGTLYYDTDTHQLLVYNGTKWVSDRSTATKIVAASDSSQALKDAADYVADGTGDQAEINSALTAAAGGQVYLAEGTYTVDGSILVPNNTTLTGSGAGAVITLPNSFSSNMSIIANSNHGLVAGNHDITISNLTIDGNALNVTGFQTGIEMSADFSGTTAMKNVIVENVIVQNLTGGGIYSEAHNGQFRGNLIDNARFGLDIEGTATHNLVTSNVFLNNSNTAIEFYGVGQSTITGNTFKNNATSIVIETTEASHNIISSNSIIGSTSKGIYLVSDSAYNVITANSIANSGGSTQNNGIVINAADNNTITNNTITDTSATTTNYAINISDTDSDANYLADNSLGSGTIHDLSDATNGYTIYGGQLDDSNNYVIQPAGGDINLVANTNITGDLLTSGDGTFQGGDLTVMTTTATDDSLVLSVSTGGTNGFYGTITNSDLTAARTWTLPDEDGTICLDSGNCSFSGVGGYVQFAPTSAQVDGNATGNSSIFINKDVAATGNILQLQKSASDVFVIDNAGNITATGTYNGNTFTGTALTFGGAGTANIGSAAGQGLNVTGHANSTISTDAGALILTSATAATWSTTAGDLTLQAGSGTVSLGNSTDLTANNALTVSAQTLTLDGGAGTVEINGGTVNINDLLQVWSTADFKDNVTVAAGKTLQIIGGTTNSVTPTAKGQLYFDTTTNQLLVAIQNPDTGSYQWKAAGQDAMLVAASNSSAADKQAADYVADGTGDQTEINYALTRAAGGKVYLFPGTYTINASISIPNNTTLAGAGTGTTITYPNSMANATYKAITNTTTTNGTGVTIQNLTVDGNKAGQTTGTFYGIYLDGMGTSTTRGATVTNVTAKNLKGSNGAGIALNNTNNIVISGSTFLSNDGTGVYFGVATSADNSSVTNSVFADNGSYGIWIYGTGNTISGNNIHDNAEGMAFAGAYNTTVSGNTIANNAYQGIDGYPGGGTGNTISGNTITNNGYQGIYFTDSDDTITGNTISDNATEGIAVFGSNNTISGNRLLNNGGGTNNNAIKVAGGSSNTITGNTITDATHTTDNYAISITSGSSNYLADNTLGGGSINDAGTSTVYGGQLDDSDNYAIQPAGDINLIADTNINGDLAVVGTGSFYGGSVLVGTTSPTDDYLKLQVTSFAGASFQGTITNANLTAVRTWTLPDASGTLCVQQTAATTTNCDLSGSFIQNQNASAQTTANFWVSGTGRASTSFLSPLFDVATTAALNIGTGNANAISISKPGVTTTVNGSLTVAQLLTGQLGATISGAAINLNASSNFATNINTGTSTGAVSIGNSAAGAISLQSGSTISLISGTSLSLTSTGANNIYLTPGGGSNTGVLLKPTTDSTAAFQIQKAGSADAILTADTTNGQVILGTAGSLSGSLVFTNSGNTNKITLTAPTTTAASYTLVLPENTPTTGLCLTTSNTNANQLVFASCFQQVSNAPIAHAAGWSANGSNITTINVAPTGPGDLLILSAGFQNNQTITNISGGGVTSWQPITSGHSGTGSLKSVEMWRGVVTSTGSSTITLTFSGSAGSTDIAVDEYTMNSAYGTWSVDTSAAQFNSSSTTVTYPSLLPQSNNELYSGYGFLGGAPGLPASCTGTFTCRTTTSGMLAYSTTSTSGVPIQPMPNQTSSASSYTIAATIIAFANNNVIVNSTNSQTGNFNVQAATAGTVAGVLQAANTGTGDILDLKNGSGTLVTSFGSTGAVLFKNSTNSTKAFEVQNATGTSIFNVDTTNAKIGTRNETAASTNSATLTVKSGDASGTTSNTGNVVIGSGNATGTSGNVTIDTGTGASTGGVTIGGTNASSVTIGRASGGGAITITGNAASTWKTTTGDLNVQGGTNLNLNTAGAGAVNIGTTNTGSIALGSTGATTSVVLQAGSAAGNGVAVQSSSATAFRVQNSGASFTLFTADASATKRVTIGATATPYGSTSSNGDLMVVGNAEVQGLLYVGNSTSNAVYTASAGGPLRFKGTARNAVSFTLTPEYAGAVMTGDGSSNAGTMTSDFCSNSSPAINTGVCGVANDVHNYYSWTTSQASAQDYDIYVRWQVPSNYDSSDSMPTIKFYGWRTNTTNDSLTMTVRNGTTTCGTATSAGGSNGAWTQATYTTGSCGTITPGTTVLTFTLHMTAATSDFVRVGEIGITYNSVF